MTDPVALARDLVVIAADLDRLMYPNAGRLRQAARALLEIDTDTATVDTCAGCGGALTQPATGRRRKYHGEACRSRARRR